MMNYHNISIYKKGTLEELDSFNFLSLDNAKEALTFIVNELFIQQPLVFRIESSNNVYTVGKYLVKIHLNIPLLYQIIIKDIPVYTTSDFEKANSIMCECSVNTVCKFTLRRIPEYFIDEDSVLS